MLIAATAALLIRTGLTGAHLQYVAGWMRWPLVATGVVLLVLAGGALLARDDDHVSHEGAHDDGHHGIPRVAWLLLLPVLAAYLVSPPAVNAYLADRRAGEVLSPGPDAYGPLPDVEVPALDVREFVWRVQDRDPDLPGRPVVMTGFVAPSDDATGWYLTRIAITCCAADAVPYRVLITGVDAPPTDSWVRVTGTFDPAAWPGPPADAVLAPDLVERVEKPRNPYL